MSEAKPVLTPEEKAKELRTRLLVAYVWGLIVWAVLAFHEIYDYFDHGNLFAAMMNGHPYVSDFSLYYAAGKLSWMAMHSPINIYDVQLQDQVLKAIIAPVAPEKPWFIQCPPPVFLFASVLPLVSIIWAWLLYCLAGNALLIYSLYLAIKPDLRLKHDFTLIAVCVCSSFPLWFCDRIGQLSLITVSLTILFFRYLRNNQTLKASWMAALMVMKFQYLPFLGLIGTARGGWRFFVSSILSGALLAAISGAFLGWPNILQYPQTVMNGEYSVHLYSGVRPEDQQNIRSMIIRITHVDSPLGNKLCIALCLFVAVLMFIAWLRGLKHVEENARFKFLCTLSLVCMLVFSPHCHKQDYLVLALPLAWIWLAYRTDPDRARKWPWRFAVSSPILSWALYVVDLIVPPIPAFVVLAALTAWAAWSTFCVPRLPAPEAAAHGELSG